MYRYRKNFSLEDVFSKKRIASRGHHEKREQTDSNTVIAKAE